MVEVPREFTGVSFTKARMPFMTALLSGPNRLPKAPPPNTKRVRFQHKNFEETHSNPAEAQRFVFLRFQCSDLRTTDQCLSHSKAVVLRDFSGGPMVKYLPSNTGDMDSIPGQKTKIPHATGQLTHVPQLLSLQTTHTKKILHDANKTQCSQIDKYGSVHKESDCNAGDAGDTGDTDSIPGSGRSPGEKNGNPLLYPCLEKPMDRGAWWATVQRVSKSRT